MPMATTLQHDPTLAQTLILDELFDLSLYKALREVSDEDSRKVLDELIVVEAQHLAFWQKFFETKLDRLNPGRPLELQLPGLIFRLVGTTALHPAPEAIEVYWLPKCLSVSQVLPDWPPGAGPQGSLHDV